MDVALQLELPSADVSRLIRLKELTRHRTQRWQTGKLSIIWHDTASAELRRANRALAEQRTVHSRHGRLSAALWRLETLHPEPQTCPPGALPNVLAEACELDRIGLELPGPLIPVTAFSGQERSIGLRMEDLGHEAVRLTVLDGELRTVAAAHPICRLTLTGPADGVIFVAQYLCDQLHVTVPTQSVAARAQICSGAVPQEPPTGTPSLSCGGSPEDGFVRLLGPLAASLFYWAPMIVTARDPDGNGEPVHHMRVAVRRLRSAMMLFKPIMDCPELRAITVGLKQLGACLGPARDWDVFLAGTAHSVSCALPDETSLASLIRAGSARRDGYYGALALYLAGTEFRRLSVTLAWAAQARPWQRRSEGASVQINATLSEFAADSVRRRRRRLFAGETDISELPDAELHAIRLRGKKLRYACEFFLPLLPGKSTKRLIRDLADLQEELGLLNDRAVATRLLDEISGPGRERARAQGVVIGYIAGVRSRERRRASAIWKRVRRGKDLLK